MRRLLTIATSVAFFAALALAETWNGKLVDASCMEQQKSAKDCNPSATTTAFVVEVDGKTYKLDDAGNAKAAEALKNRADRMAPGAPVAPSAVAAKITGTKDGDIIKVESLEVRQ